VLGELVHEARRRASELRPREAELASSARSAGAAASFVSALRRTDVAVICEIKRRSPSKGVIAENLDVSSRAREYATGGAAALSVLTEPTRFGGSLTDLETARREVGLPIVRKDFIVDPLQLLETRTLGASAVLLIARALPPTRLLELARLAADLGLDALVEVRDERELAVALESGAPVVGVNTRNLETLAIDPATAELLIPMIPRDRVAVFESGISTRADVERAAACGADAVLVGSSISAAADASRAVSQLAGVPARPRGSRA